MVPHLNGAKQTKRKRKALPNGVLWMSIPAILDHQKKNL